MRRLPVSATNTSFAAASKVRQRPSGDSDRVSASALIVSAERMRLTPPASAVVAAVTGQPLELVRPLMESLETDILPREPEVASRLYGIRPLGFTRAVDRALREWETRETLGAR